MSKPLDETWMWNRAQELLEEADRLQRQFFQLGQPGSRGWEPPVDVFETSSELWILVALPGVRPEAVEVEVEERRLSIRGERRLPGGLRRATVHRLEIPHGRFSRLLELPEGAVYRLATRRFENGCLALGLTKEPCP